MIVCCTFIISLQASAEGLRSQNTNLASVLAIARVEIAARKEQVVKLTSQFQVGPLLVVVLL